MRNKATLPPGPWRPVRSHENYDGPYFDIEPEERAKYDARPFTGIRAPGDVAIVSAHDLFEFRPGVAELLAAAPELLAALEAVVGMTERHPDLTVADLTVALDQARAVINAAKGETQT